jgi:hypothetical protein
MTMNLKLSKAIRVIKFFVTAPSLALTKQNLSILEKGRENCKYFDNVNSLLETF